MSIYHRLHVEDPAELGAMLPAMPTGLGIAHLVTYDTNRKREVICSKPGCGTPHHRGFVCVLEDGRCAPIGRNCGEAMFGAKWEAAQKARSQLAARQRRIAWAEQFRAAYAANADAIETWRPHMEAIHKARLAMRALDERVWRDLAGLVQAGGIMSDGDVVWRVMGYQFFSDLNNPAPIYGEAMREIERALSVAADGGVGLTKIAGEALSDLRRAADRYATARKCLAPANIQRIRAWAENRYRIDWGITGTRLPEIDQSPLDRIAASLKKTT